MLHGRQLPPSPAAQGSRCPCFLQVKPFPPNTLFTLLPLPFPLSFLVKCPVTSLAVSHKAHISHSIQPFKEIKFQWSVAFNAEQSNSEIEHLQDLHLYFYMRNKPAKMPCRNLFYKTNTSPGKATRLPGFYIWCTCFVETLGVWVSFALPRMKNED